MAWGALDLRTALRIFNLGIGMIVVAPANSTTAICQQLPAAVVIGELVGQSAAAERVMLTT
jgi:phosphoribosylaminoimidazole (AIR) synthetase